MIDESFANQISKTAVSGAGNNPLMTLSHSDMSLTQPGNLVRPIDFIRTGLE